MPFRILTVCTGNICRSPAMEFVLAQALAGDDRFAVRSAGTHAERGWPVNPPMDRLLQARGIDVSAFAARQADRAMLAESDLILTATQQHLAWVTEHEPRSVRRAFTMTAEAWRLPGGSRQTICRRRSRQENLQGRVGSTTSPPSL